MCCSTFTRKQDDETRRCKNRRPFANGDISFRQPMKMNSAEIVLATLATLYDGANDSPIVQPERTDLRENQEEIGLNKDSNQK